MCACVCVQNVIFMCVFATYICIGVCVNMHICVNFYTFSYMYLYVIYICIIPACACENECIHTFQYTYIYMYMYTCTHMYTN